MDCTANLCWDLSASKSKDFIDKRDSRCRLTALFLISVPLAISQSFTAGGAGLALSLFFLLFSGIHYSSAFRHLLNANLFILLIWLATPFTTPGRELFHYGIINVSMEGCRVAALVTLKSNAIIIMFMALASNIPIPETGWALQQLKVPEKLCLIMVFSYRHIFVIGKEYNRLATAARVRGFKPSTNLRTYRTYAYLAAMTIIRSWNRAEKTRQAMALRGFNNRFFILGDRSIKVTDWLFLTTSFLLSTTFFIL